MNYQIERKQAEPMSVACCTANATAAEIPNRMGAMFHRVMVHATKAGAGPTGPAFAQYLTMEEPFEFRAGFQVANAFASRDGVEFGELPGGEVLSTVHVGPYEKLAEAYAALMSYAQENGLTPGESMWEYYWTDPQTTPDPADWKTEVFMPLA